MPTRRANLGFGKQRRNEEGSILWPKVRELRKVKKRIKGKKRGKWLVLFWLSKLFQTKSVFNKFAKLKGKKEKKKNTTKGT